MYGRNQENINRFPVPQFFPPNFNRPPPLPFVPLHDAPFNAFSGHERPELKFLTPEEEKRNAIESFLKRKCYNKEPCEIVSISVSDFRQTLLNAFCLVEELSQLVSTYVLQKEFQMQQVKLKGACEEMCSVVQTCLPLIKAKMKRKKRSRRTSGKSSYLLENERKRAELHAQMDAWQEELKQKQIQEKQAVALKSEADAILCEVRRKSSETKRLLDRLRMLEKLRTARIDNNPGVFAGPGFDSRVSCMRQSLCDRLQEYDAEERALRIHLQEEEELEEGRQKKEAPPYAEYLFGGEEPSPECRLFYDQQNASNEHVPTLICVRRQWDAFVSADGEPLPQKWVAPTKDNWKTLK